MYACLHAFCFSASVQCVHKRLHPLGFNEKSVDALVGALRDAREYGGTKINNRGLSISMRCLLPHHPLEALRLLRGAFHAAVPPLQEEGEGERNLASESLLLGPISPSMFATTERNENGVPSPLVYKKCFVSGAKMIEDKLQRQQFLHNVLDMWLEQYPHTANGQVRVQ